MSDAPAAGSTETSAAGKTAEAVEGGAAAGAGHQSASTGEITRDPAAAAEDDKTIAIKVYSPFKVYYEGRGYSISAVNAVGPFDVLPKHHNFLCMLEPCDITISTPHGVETIKIYRGLMHVKADAVTVFVDV